MSKTTKRKTVKVGNKRVQRVDHMKQPNKEDGGGGRGVVVRGGWASFQQGILILWKLESEFQRTHSSHQNGSFI